MAALGWVEGWLSSRAGVAGSTTKYLSTLRDCESLRLRLMVELDAPWTTQWGIVLSGQDAAFLADLRVQLEQDPSGGGGYFVALCELESLIAGLV